MLCVIIVPGGESMLSKKIRLHRIAAGLTQTELADKIGIQMVLVSRWERGQNTPRPKYIPLLAEALEVDALYLLKEDE